MADIDQADASEIAIGDDDVVGAHAGDVGAGAGGFPHDAARVADRKIASRLRHGGKGVIQMRIKINDGGCAAADGNIGALTRRNVPRTLGSKRLTLVESVPITVTWPPG